MEKKLRKKSTTHTVDGGREIRPKKHHLRLVVYLIIYKV